MFFLQFSELLALSSRSSSTIFIESVWIVIGVDCSEYQRVVIRSR